MRGLVIAAAALVTACQAQAPGVEAGFASFHEPSRCLTASGSPGAGVVTGGGCTQPAWRIASSGAGPRALYTISSLENGLCLEVPAALGGLVRMEPCSGAAAQHVMIDAFRRAPSAGDYDVVRTGADSDLAEYPGLIVQAGSGCLSMEPTGAVALQPCADPITGRFNPLTEWTLSPKPEAR